MYSHKLNSFRWTLSYFFQSVNKFVAFLYSCMHVGVFQKNFLSVSEVLFLDQKLFAFRALRHYIGLVTCNDDIQTEKQKKWTGTAKEELKRVGWFFTFVSWHGRFVQWWFRNSVYNRIKPASLTPTSRILIRTYMVPLVLAQSSCLFIRVKSTFLSHCTVM